MGNTLAIMLICLAGWTQLFPEDARAIIYELKRQIRTGMLRRGTMYSAKGLRRSLHSHAAQQGIDARLVDQFLAEHQKEVLANLEKIYVDRLGDPDDPASWN